MTHTTKPPRLLAALACLAPLLACAAEPASPPPAASDLTPAECEVWAREVAFARSVADRDAVAFAGFVHPGAAFNTGQAEPLRGRDRIVEAWAGIIAGKDLRLSWYPSRVTIGAAANVAWSSGPALFEWPDRPPAQRYAIGTYHSVWTRDADGRWRVLFDEGAGRAPADADAAQRFRAQGPRPCPARDAPAA